MHKIYLSCRPAPFGVQGIAMADDGHVLAHHTSSTAEWSRHDLGLESTWKHDHYNKHFGLGNWELEWVAEHERPTHAGWLAALKLNRELETATIPGLDP